VYLKIKVHGCDNVLPGKGYFIPQRAEIDEYGAMIE
jgi:hypothetical protein